MPPAFRASPIPPVVETARPYRPIGAAISDLESLGYWVGAALSRSEVEGYRALILREAEEALARGSGTTGSSQRVWNLLGLKSDFAKLAAHPVPVVLARHLLGPDVFLSSFCANIVWPGSGPHFLHADQDGAPMPWDATTILTIIWALDEFSERSGATRVVPASHKRRAPPPYGRGLPETVPVLAPAGSVLAMDGRLWHQAGANGTSTPRVAVLATYALPILARHPFFTDPLDDDVRVHAGDELLAVLGPVSGR
jgi:hypothetical protein